MEPVSNSSYLFLRGLRQVDHTVFCVQDGQKFYFDPQFRQRMPYSSGQQVKRSVMDLLSQILGEPRAPITFNYEINRKDELENKEPWSPCDPTYADQLVGGWMRARPKMITLKRRSPLSISAMRPLHPLLAGDSTENLTFDRSDHPERHPVRVLNAEGHELSEEEVNEWLDSNQRTLPRRHWIPNQRRANGLFVFDIAIDLGRLFKVSTNRHDPELDPEQIDLLKSKGWVQQDDQLICPEARRNEIIPALAHALVNWRVTSNQSRTFSPQPTLCLAISGNANRIVNAIRAELAEEEQRAMPVIDQSIAGTQVFIFPVARGYIPGVVGDPDAMELAEQWLIDRLSSFIYDA